MASSSHREIPGFYYDAERNRYFKLPNGHQHLHGLDNIMTDRKKQSDERRGVRLSRDQEGIYGFLNKRSTRILECDHVTDRQIEENILSSTHRNEHVSDTINEKLKRVSGNISDLKIDKSGEIIAVSKLSYNSAPEYVTERLQFLFPRSNHYGILSVGQSLWSVQNMQKDNFHMWSDFYSRGEDTSEILYGGFKAVYKCSITRNHKRKQWDIATIHNTVFTGRVNTLTTFTSDRDGNIVWGCGRGICFCNYVSSGNKSRYDLPDRTPVTALVSMKESPMICAGCKSGCVHFIDQRLSKVIKTIEIPCVDGRWSPVIKLHPFHYDTGLITSAMNSQLHSWDLRMYRRTQNFQEHKNSHHYTSSLVDDREIFVVAVSDDDVINTWSLATGKLLYTISLPEDELHPVICHTHTLGGHRGHPALLVSTGGSILTYTVEVT